MTLTDVEKIAAEAMAGHDAEQIKFMNEDMVILVDGCDKATGAASKVESHLMVNINKGMLHRAFSVFLFNSKGELLLQKRSAKKITFPARWTNTCCSHPLSRESELIDENQLGVKNAAIRKLEQELGISPADVEVADLHFLTRIHYLAPSDETWGEHEVDYILFAQKDLKYEGNKDEVSDVMYVTQQQLKDLITKANDEVKNGVPSGEEPTLITPWFNLIDQAFLYTWWDSLLAGDLAKHVDGKVHKL
eukprot:TRINITY_DN2052_c0_g1_i1.p1 TRINITY_DN2052_c0_g1~~TRINITY_DN2052_c0_g1_i1.p1  ORF type:complete len:248 (+),score=75.98 TRINITY_DN2052_c0_g1_i1:140-883(+)